MSWRDHADLAQEVILDAFADRDPAGVLSVTYEPEGGVARPIRAIFREPHEELALDPLQAPVSMWRPRLGVKIADLLPDWPIPRGSRFVIRRPPAGDPRDDASEGRYEVVDRQIDGEGLVELYLRLKD